MLPKHRAIYDLVIVIAVTLIAGILSYAFHVHETIHDLVMPLEKWQIDELIPTSLVLVIMLTWYFWRRKRDVFHALASHIRDENLPPYSEDILKLLYEYAPDAFYLYDRKGHFLDGNKAAEEMVGYKKDELIGKSFLKLGLLSADQIPRAARQLAKNVLGQRTGPDEYVLTRKDGTTVHMEANSVPFRFGDTTLVMGIARDINERHRSERRIKDQKKFIEKILESITHPLYVLDAKNYTILMANAAARLGTLDKTCTCYGLTHHRDTPCEGEHACPLAEVKRTKKPVTMEHVHYDKDGNLRNVEVHGFPLFDDKGDVVQMIEYSIDITERKKAEAALAISEEKFRTLFESSRDAIMTLIPGGRFTSGNPAVIELFGCADETEFIAQTPGDLSPEYQPDGRPSSEKAQEMMSLAMESGSHFFEWRHRKIDGTEFPATVLLTRTRMEEKDILQATVRDITNQKKAQDDLQQAKDYAELLFRVVPSAIFTVDMKRRITSWNDKAVELTGYTHEEALGKECLFFALEPCRRKCGLFAQDVQKPMSAKECTIRHKDGHVMTISKNADLLRDSDGNVVGGIESFEDITARKKTEQELHSMTMFPLFNPNIVAKLDKNGDTLFVNSHTRKLLDRYRSDNLDGLLPPGYRYMIAEAIRTGKTIKGIEHRHGKRYFTYDFTPFEEKEVYVYGKDITKLKNAEDTARRANQMKSEFLANMSHELRTPLNSVIGFSEVLYDEAFGNLNEKQKDYLNDILESGKHLLSLIDDVLDLSKIEAGRTELSPSTFNLRTLLENSMVMIKEKALKHGITLSTDVAEDVGDVEADERKIKQVVFNLLSNAGKFTPDGGTIGIRAKKLDGNIEISVWDTGPGISKEDLAKVFDEFVQLESALTKKHKGTGLGLALTKRFVELHGGTIRAESEGEGKGASFILTLPVKRRGSEHASNKEGTDN